ncbi:MAG: hypothetical protein ACTHLR_08680 [Rhizomicrobium sp.]
MEMKRRRRTYEDMDFESGVLRSTIKNWRYNVPLPQFPSISAALGALGWDFEALPFACTLPARLRKDLDALIDKYADDFPVLNVLAEVPTRRA